MTSLDKEKQEKVEQIPDFLYPYQITSLKSRLKEGKRFTRYYFSEFKPVSQLEEKDWKEAKTLYKGAIAFPPVAIIFM